MAEKWAFLCRKGDFCGEMPLFDELARPEYVIAPSSSLVVKVPAGIKSIMLENSDDELVRQQTSSESQTIDLSAVFAGNF